jgi:glycosyltransferase involved in cell wall biosynthesis
MAPGVEILVVDGASPDDTPGVMKRYAARHPEIRYIRESENSGVDRDYDKAVAYARGEYCWLMTDDDLLRPGAIARVLAALDGGKDLLIVNAEVRSADLSVLLERRLLKLEADRDYGPADRDAMLSDTAGYLSFIGGVVVRRTRWLSRDRASYYGTLFIHVGVIFQNPPLEAVRVIADPLLTIRYGNAMWTPRRFEIWMFKWPTLIWSFPDFSDRAKRKICRREPWRSPLVLFYNRGLGAYTEREFQKLWPGGVRTAAGAAAWLLSRFPASWANFVVVLYFLLKRQAPLALFDFLQSPPARALSRFAARAFGSRPPGSDV